MVVTIRYLATGVQYRSLDFQFLISFSTISLIVRDVCAAIWELRQQYLMIPQNEEDWQRVANGFQLNWNMPNCIGNFIIFNRFQFLFLGAIDGKHIRLAKPPHSGTLNYNYKHFFSTVLMGVCDSRYRLVCVDIGSPGSNSDGGVFATSSLKKLMDSNQLNVPAPTQLPQSTEETPCYFVGDAAFPLRIDLMKPFPRQQLNHDEKIFNYR